MNDLQSKPDLDLIQYIKCQAPEASDSAKILAERHGGIVTTVINKYSAALMSSGVYKNDLIQDKAYLIWDTATKFDPAKKTKYPTWLYEQTRYYCLNAMTEERYKQRIVDALIATKDSSENYSSYKTELINFVNNYVQSLADDRAKYILTRRFFDAEPNGKKITMQKIAEEVGITSQYCYNIINKHLKEIRSLLQKQYA